MLEMPPPNTITSGSNTFTSAASFVRAGPGRRQAIERRQAHPIAQPRQFAPQEACLGKRKVLSRQARSRKEGFYATKLSAVTPISRALFFCGPWEWIMSPLPTNAIKSS